MRRTLRSSATLLLALLVLAIAVPGAPAKGRETEKVSVFRTEAVPAAGAPAGLLVLKPAARAAEEELPNLPTRPSRDATPIGALKFLPDGEEVTISQKIVTIVLQDRFYVQEVDRSSGIRAVTFGYPMGVAPGSVVTFSGTLATTNFEREIQITSSIQVHLNQAPLPEPLGMRTSAVVGGPLNAYTPGKPGSWELHSSGLRVMVWGRAPVDGFVDDTGGWCFYIDDGCEVIDGPYLSDPSQPLVGVRVYSDMLPNAGDFKAVRGVCGMVMWDPTPLEPYNGDTVPIRVIYTSELGDVFDPQPSGPPPATETVTGTIRLVGATTPQRARIYGTRSSVTLPEANDTSQPFSLPNIPVSGALITATAPGYTSQSRMVYGGESDVQIELSRSAVVAGIVVDKTSIRNCSLETAAVLAFIRDSEGKGLANYAIKLTTTRGVFAETGTSELIGQTDDDGRLAATLESGADGQGVGQLAAQDYPDQTSTARATVMFTGPEISALASPVLVASSGVSIISAALTEDQDPVVDMELVFKTDFGGFDEADGGSQYIATTDSTGTASATLRLPEAGAAKVLVSYVDACKNAAVAWAVAARRGTPWQTSQTQASSPLIDRLTEAPDGSREVAIVTTDRKLMVWRANGSLAWEKHVPSVGNNTPACADLDGDPDNGLEIVVPLEEQQKVWVYRSTNGIPLAGWPVTTNYTFKSVAATLADVNLDGALEVLAGDESCYVFAWNSTGDWEGYADPAGSFIWRNLTGTTGTAIYGSTVAVGDVDADGMPDAVVGANLAPEVYAFPGDAWGDHVSPPLYVPGWPKPAHSRVESSPAIGDIDGDGKNDVAVGSDIGRIYLFTSGDGEWRGYQTGGPVRSSPALADLDGDGLLDVVVGSDDGRVYAINHRGEHLPGWDGGILLNPHTKSPVRSSPVVADINYDGLPEVVVGCSDGFVYALYPDGTLHRDTEGKAIGPLVWVRCAIPEGMESAEVLSSPAIDDLNGNGKIDIIVGSTGGIFRYELDSTLVRDAVHMPWPTFHRDNARTGFAGTYPEPRYSSIMGRVTKDGQPVLRAQVFITFADGSPVPEPHSNPVRYRNRVLTVGEAQLVQANKGIYSINRLEAGLEYVIRVQSVGSPDKLTNPFTPELGLNRIDIQLE